MTKNQIRKIEEIAKNFKIAPLRKNHRRVFSGAAKAGIVLLMREGVPRRTLSQRFDVAQSVISAWAKNSRWINNPEISEPKELKFQGRNFEPVTRSFDDQQSDKSGLNRTNRMSRITLRNGIQIEISPEDISADLLKSLEVCGDAVC